MWCILLFMDFLGNLSIDNFKNVYYNIGINIIYEKFAKYKSIL